MTRTVRITLDMIRELIRAIDESEAALVAADGDDTKETQAARDRIAADAIEVVNLFRGLDEHGGLPSGTPGADSIGASSPSPDRAP